MSTKHDPKHETKREGRADETEPPIGTGEPEPPFAEPAVPVEKVRVFGDASATYGSMIPPQTIHPYQEEIDEMTEPVRKEQAKKEEKRRKDEEPPPESKPEPVYEKLRRYPGEGDVSEPREEDPHPGLYVQKKEDKAPHAEGQAAEDERNKKREAKDDKPSAKGPHDR